MSCSLFAKNHGMREAATLRGYIHAYGHNQGAIVAKLKCKWNFLRKVLPCECRVVDKNRHAWREALTNVLAEKSRTPMRLA
jgi:hypothetical protein